MIRCGIKLKAIKDIWWRQKTIVYFSMSVADIEAIQPVIIDCMVALLEDERFPVLVIRRLTAGQIGFDNYHPRAAVWARERPRRRCKWRG